jgi:hypothetical protein
MHVIPKAIYRWVPSTHKALSFFLHFSIHFCANNYRMRKLLLPVVLISFAVALTHCTPARMALNDDAWQNKQAYNVEGRRGLFTKERMSFGDYYTKSVKRSWTKTSSSRSGWTKGNVTDPNYENIISVEYMKRKQTVKFEMTDDSGNASEVYCVARFNSQDLQIGNYPNDIKNIAAEILLGTDNSDSKYYVQLYTNNYDKPWQLVLDNQQWQARPKKYTGIIALDKDNYYTLVPVTQMQRKDGTAANMPFGAIGLEIRNPQGKPVAAVSLIDKGVVYLSGVPAGERFLLANICAALLMQEQLG